MKMVTIVKTSHHGISNFGKFSVLFFNLKTLSFIKVSGGREGRPIGAYELAKAVEELGAGEILLNCIDCDGEDDFLIP